MRCRLESSLILLVVTLVALVAFAPAAEGRIQGAKGRRLQLFGPIAPYAGGTVFVEEPDVVIGHSKRVVQELGFRRYAQQFLETRLRELPWRVELWHDELGPVETLDVDGPALAVSTVVTHQGGAGGGRLVLESFFRDQASGEVVARYSGYGRARVRGAWPGARDDLQEITRVLVDQLAPELDAVAPLHLGGYDSRPYRRRERTIVSYETVRGDAAPRMALHGEPPVQNDAPIDRRFRDVPDEVHRRHFEPSSGRADGRRDAREHARHDASEHARHEAHGRPSGPSPSGRADAPSRARRSAPEATLAPRSSQPGERRSAPGRSAPSRGGFAAPSDATVFAQQGDRLFHVEPHCLRLATRTPRRLSGDMARAERLQPCPRCVGPDGAR